MADALYTLHRYEDGVEVHRQGPLDHKTATGIVTMLWGEVPTTLAEGGKLGEEWKLSFGEGVWVLVVRER